jgi:hypothetical protein
MVNTATLSVVLHFLFSLSEWAKREKFFLVSSSSSILAFASFVWQLVVSGAASFRLDLRQGPWFPNFKTQINRRLITRNQERNETCQILDPLWVASWLWYYYQKICHNC